MDFWAAIAVARLNGDITNIRLQAMAIFAKLGAS